MTELVPHSKHRPESAPASSAVVEWDVEHLAGALKASPEHVADLALGDGVRFQLGGDPGTTLEIFPTGPRAPIVRVTGEDVQLSLFRQASPPRIVAEGLVFELPESPERRWLSLSSTGATTLFYGLEAAKSPGEQSERAKRLERAVSSETAFQGNVRAPERYQQALPEGRQEKQPRVTFSGRLGADPRCRTTPKPNGGKARKQ